MVWAAVDDWAKAHPAAVVAAASAAFLSLVVFVAPFAIWRQERERATKAEDALKPKFSVTAVMRGGDGEQLTGCIQVRNEHVGPLVNCVGELKAAYTQIEGERRPVENLSPFYFRWSDRYQSDRGNPKLTFTRDADLEVVQIDRGCRIRLLTFHPAKLIADQMQSKDTYLPERSCYILDIEISAENTAPVRREFRISAEFPTDRGRSNGQGGWIYGPPPVWRFVLP